MRLSWRRAITCIVFGMGFTFLVFGQEADLDRGSASNRSSEQLADTTRVLEEVLVLDNHVRRRKQEESLHVEIISKDYIQRHLGGSLMHTLERLPGVQMIGIGAGQSKPLVRGLGFNRIVVVDKGIKHEGQQWGSDHGLELDQFAAGEVEIVKGAASFVYGSDAIGGAIDVKPEVPPARNTIAGSVDLIGRSNNGLYGGSVRLGARGDKWFVDSRATHLQFADYRVPADTVYVYDYAVQLHEGRLRNTAGRETNLHASAGYLGEGVNSILYLSNNRSVGGFFANAHGLEPRHVDTDTHDKSARDILMPRQQVNHFKVISRNAMHLGEHHLEAELGFQRNYRQEYSAYVNHGYMPPVFPTDLGVSHDLERQFDKYVYNLRITDYWKVGNHDVTFGISGEYQDNAIDGWTFLVPAFTQANAGTFVYDRYRVHDRLLLHGALRYDYGRLRTTEYRDWFPSQPNDGDEWEQLVRAESMERVFGSFVWSVGANYNPSDRWSFKTNVGKSFRMPLAKELAANGVNYHYFSYEQGNPDLRAEQSYQIDLTAAWQGGNWEVQVSPFYNYFPNYIYLNPTASFDHFYGAGNQVFRYEESEVMRYGSEFHVAYRVRPSVRVEATGEYVHAIQLSGAKRGFPLPFSPPSSMLATVTWSPQVPGLVGRPYFSVDYRLVGRQDRIVPPERKTNGYGVASLQAGLSMFWLGSPIHLRLQIQNIFDTKYMSHTSFYRLIELPEMGRNIVLSLRVPFQKSLD